MAVQKHEIAASIGFIICGSKNAFVQLFCNAFLMPVPLKLRNAPTGLMKKLGYGRDYRYAHDEPDAFAAGERYLPDEMPDRRYYRPVPRGLELKISEALERLRKTQPKPKGSE